MRTRTALVTGGSRGIGKATAVALARAGFDVAFTARTLHEGEGLDDSDSAGRSVPGSLDTTAGLVAAEKRRALPIAMDLLDRDSIVAAADRVYDEWGHLDVLVNNAVHTGPGSMARFDDTTVEMIETKLAANVVAQVVLVKLALPGMVEHGEGTIVNVTSAVAVNDPPAPAGEGGWGAAYAMSKGAFHRLAGILAVELGPRGVRVFNVEPGFVLTERMEVNQRALGLEGVYPGAPPSVPAAVVAWLATDPGAAELNGQTISAQKFARERALHGDWRAGPARPGN
jgi:NAD(P)-dependent dehydrogenase (short-subunit alcohol dehydrogenase family)